MFEPTPLRVARATKGMSQTELAELVGVSQRYVSQLECGMRPQRSEIPARIADALGRPVAELFPTPRYP